jgi:wings apart-like regulator of heterochromatin
MLSSKLLGEETTNISPQPTTFGASKAAATWKRPKATYAGQRSILSNDDTDSNPTEKSLTSHSFELCQLRESAPPFSLLPNDDENDGTGGVQSIHELRHAGKNARWQGIIDSIFEDIENTAIPLSGRRGGFIQLCKNLKDHQFTRRFVETRLDRRLGAWITTHPDDILAYLALCAYGFILSTGPLHSSTLMSIWPQVLALTPSMLDIDEDISSVVRQRHLGLSRSTQADIRDIASCASRGLIELFPSWLSPERMALRCLELIIRKIHEIGEAVDRIPDGLLTQFIGLLFKHSSKTQDFGRKSIDFLMLESTFSILEAYSSLPGSLGNSHGNIWTPLAKLSHLLPTLGRASECRCRELRLLYIKLILNITNNNSSLCEDFASPGLIQPIVEIVLSDFQLATEDIVCDKKNPLDTVILSLGVLINLTEESKISRKVFSTLRLESRSLFHHLLHLFSVGFAMASEVRLLHCLITISNMFQADSVVKTHFNVAFGYLSILLSTLSLDSDIRLRLKNSLGGSGLIRVLATVEEFIQYHHKVDDEMNGFECKFDSVVKLTSRLQVIIDVIRRTEAESIHE